MSKTRVKRSRGRTLKTGTFKDRTFKGGEDPRSKSVFHTTKISTEQNKDSTYMESGVVHLSDSKGINIVRGAVTEITNIFGAKGFSNVIYDELRNTTLRELQKMLRHDEKICNLRMEFTEPQPGLIFHHAYGTLYRKRLFKPALKKN